MFCGQCGTQVADGAAFCPNCGAAMAAAPVNDIADEELRAAEQRYTGGQSGTGQTGYSYGQDQGYGQSYGAGQTGGYTGGRGPSWDYTRTPTHTGFGGFLEYWVMMWKHYTNKKGRATRMEFWSVVLCNFVISFLLGLIPGTAGTVISTIYTLAVLVPSICVYIRRAHDINQSGSHVAVIYVLYLIGMILTPVGSGLIVAGLVWSWFGPSGMLVGGVILTIIGVILLIVYLVLILRLGLKQSWPQDNEYGPYPHKTL